jgi:pyrimidine-nucleoside phosphorylase
MALQPADIITCKRNGEALSDEQIRYMVENFATGTIPDYQMAALAMAIFLKGMDARETTTLTSTMLESGDTLNWPDDGSLRVDKHSTGGIGDKISLVLAPLLAASGLQVPMISGRGLGPTGGTLDKLESIPGFRTDLDTDQIETIVADVGCVITSATASLAPADRKLYALRDVTGTVPSVPLITGSILSKKLAANLDALVLDVKFGSGAFMKSIDEARQLAHSLVTTAAQLGLNTSALLTDMNQPLGRAVGNLLEVNEALAVLAGEGPAEVRELTLALARELLSGVGQPTENLEQLLDDGSAREQFERMVHAQGGDLDQLATPTVAFELSCSEQGWLAAVDAEQLGLAVIQLGGGRTLMGEAIDHQVGLEMTARIGDAVEQGQPLVVVYANDSSSQSSLQQQLAQAFTISQQPPGQPTLVVERVTAEQPEKP